MPIELRHLRYALAAYEHRSFRKAAAVLRLKQSSLSRRIQQLEDELGVALFIRTSAGVRPTRAGSDLLRRAQHITNEVQAMALLAKAEHQAKAGHLGVGFYTSLSAGHLRTALLDFKARYPEVVLGAFEGSRASLLAKLQSGTLDIVIVSGEEDVATLQTLPLWTERIIIALPRTHQLADRAIVYWNDVKGEHFVLSSRDPGSEFEDLLMAKLAAPGDRPAIVRHNVSRENLLGMVGAGWGVSLLYESGTGMTHPGVIYREVCDGHGATRMAHSAYWCQDNTNPVLSSFLSLLKQRYPSVGGV
jgi:DNA-binding transcriptional LysR family regulator